MAPAALHVHVLTTEHVYDKLLVINSKLQLIRFDIVNIQVFFQSMILDMKLLHI